MLLPKDGKIVLIHEPVSARYGAPRMLDLLYSNYFDFYWNGVEQLTIITFNESLSICKIFNIDAYGHTCATRRLKKGRFRQMLFEGRLPTTISRRALEKLLTEGTISLTLIL